MTSFSSFRKQSEREFEKKFRCCGGVPECKLEHESMAKDMSEEAYKDVKSFLSQKLEEAYRMGVEEVEKRIPKKKSEDDIEKIKTFDFNARRTVTLMIKRWEKYNQAIDQFTKSLKELKSEVKSDRELSVTPTSEEGRKK